MGASAGGHDPPHVAAVTRPMEAITYIAETISRLERGEPVSGQVDRQRGY